jgi:lipoate-protein ligase A
MPSKSSSTTGAEQRTGNAAVADQASEATTELRLHTDTHCGRAPFDTAVTHALLRQVASGAIPESLRLYTPDDIAVFSLLDARRPRFAEAVAAADAAGCDAVLRLGGGHAALFHRRTLAFSWAMPAERAHDGIRARFEAISELIAAALRRLGVDARVGAVPGEYCPGEHSVNAGGRSKLMGVGQRVIRGAAHVGGVIVVADSDRVRNVLQPIYALLELDWDPSTAGSIEDELGKVSAADVESVLLEELRLDRTLRYVGFDSSTLALAAELEPWHRPGGDPREVDASVVRALSDKTMAADHTP